MRHLISFCLSTLLFYSLIAAQTKESVSGVKDTLQKEVNKIDQKANSAVKDSVITSDKAADVPDSSSSADSTVKYSLTIKTVPDSVVIVINDSVAGISPLTITSLVSGEYTFVLKKKGFYQKKVTTFVDSASVKELNLVLQQPGTIVVNSDPAGADVTVNGEKKGLTPQTITPVKPGEYSIQLKKDTFNTFQKSITVLSGKTDSIFCKMVPDTAITNSYMRSQKKEKSKKTKVTSIVLAVAFCLFAGIVTIIDFSGNK